VKGPAGFYKSIMFYRIEGAKGLNFLRKGRVTYVTGQRLILDFYNVNVAIVLRFRC
jgi:hypothetical protein